MGTRLRSRLDAAATSALGLLDDRDVETLDLDLVYALHQRLIAEIDPQKLASLDRAQGYDAVITAARRTLGEVAPQVVGESRDLVLDAVADEVLGLGPIEKLVRDRDVSEIMVNGADLIYFEQAGVIYKTRDQVPGRRAHHAHHPAHRCSAGAARR